MGTFDIGHPDVHRVHPRQARERPAAPVNLSLLITDEFMQAVRADTDWQLAFPITQKEFDAETMNLDDPSQFIWRE